MMIEFDPSIYSIEEARWLMKHVGEPWVVASQDIKPVYNPNVSRNQKGQIIDHNPMIYPDGVIPASVKPAIDGIYELIELEKHEKEPWAGVEVVKGALETFVAESEKWAKNAGRRGAPRFPSMHTIDQRGRAFLGGTGADAGVVRSYYDNAGNRVPFAVKLVASGDEAWRPDWMAQNAPAVAAPKRLVNNETLGRLECFCGHTEKYNKESRSSLSAARARASKHLRKATEFVDDHRELHTQEFS